MEQDKRMAFELIGGIVVICLLAEIGILWYGQKKGIYSIGLLVGGALSVGMVLHMRWSIRLAVETSEQEIKKRMMSGAVFRSVVVIAFLILAGNYRVDLLFPIFVGLLSLKISAYLQPFIHRALG